METSSGSVRAWLAVLAALLASLMILLTAESASAHDSSVDSVDCTDTAGRCEIRWTSTTKYPTSRDYGISIWNAYRTATIAPDDVNSGADVLFEDYQSTTDGWASYHNWRSGITDRIRFNTYFMDPYSSGERRAVAVHELGHAFGLRDLGSNDSCGGYLCKTRAIMWGTPAATYRATGQNTPFQHDVDDYYSRSYSWGYTL